MVQTPPWERDVRIGRFSVDTAINVVSALEAAGIRPRAERTGPDVELFVRQDERDRARQVLAPARPAPEAAGPPSPPDVEPGVRRRWGPPAASGDTDEAGRPLLSERMRRLGRPLALLLAVLIAITLSYQGPVVGAIAVAVAVGAIAVWLRNRVRRDDERRYGD